MKKNLTSLDEMKDSVLGKVGTKRRDKYEKGFQEFFYGEAIKMAREEKGLTQKQVADRCGINKSYISKIENNVKEARISTLEKIVTEGLGGKLELNISF
ncbi:MAG: helix-turn-helix transcriptional regulator [Candidatus Kapaibacteriales bacterium]